MQANFTDVFHASTFIFYDWWQWIRSKPRPFLLQAIDDAATDLSGWPFCADLHSRLSIRDLFLEALEIAIF